MAGLSMAAGPWENCARVIPLVSLPEVFVRLALQYLDRCVETQLHDSQQVVVARFTGVGVDDDRGQQYTGRLRADRLQQIIEPGVAYQGTPPVLSPLVLAELDFLIARKLGTGAELAMLEDVAARAYQLAPMGSGDVAAARTIVERYRDLGVGIADVSLVVLAGKHSTADILTLDERHFRAMHTGKGNVFRVLPADP